MKKYLMDLLKDLLKFALKCSVISLFITTIVFANSLMKYAKFDKLEAKEPESVIGSAFFTYDDDSIIAHDDLHYSGLVANEIYTVTAELVKDGKSVALSEPQVMQTAESSTGEAVLTFRFPRGDINSIENCTIRERVTHTTFSESNTDMASFRGKISVLIAFGIWWAQSTLFCFAYYGIVTVIACNTHYSQRT